MNTPIDGEDLVSFCTFLGTDYIDKIKGLGPRKISNFFANWKAANTTEKKEILSSVGDDYAEKFEECLNLFTLAPVFGIIPNTWDALKSGQYSVELKPLRDYNGASSWDTAIGFKPTELVTGEAVIHKAYYSLNSYAATGEILMSHKLPLPKENGNYVPFGAVLDFEAVPVEMQCLAPLVTWLSLRRINVPTEIANNRPEIINFVKLAILRNITVSVQENASSMLHQPDIGTGSGHYISWDMLFSTAPSQWNKFNASFLAEIRARIPIINANFIDNIFGRKRNGIRLRALKAVLSGHYDIESMMMAGGNVELDVGGRRQSVKLVTVTVTPSMKAKVYHIYLVFNTCDSSYMPSPVSRCSCPAGRLFCSHMLGLFLVLYCIQARPQMNESEFLNLFPPNVKVIQAFPISLKDSMKNTTRGPVKSK